MSDALRVPNSLSHISEFCHFPRFPEQMQANARAPLCQWIDGVIRRGLPGIYRCRAKIFCGRMYIRPTSQCRLIESPLHVNMTQTAMLFQ